MPSHYIRNTDKCSSYVMLETGMQMTWERAGYEDQKLGVLEKASIFIPYDRTQPPTFSAVALQSSTSIKGYEDIEVTTETMKLLATDILSTLMESEDVRGYEYAIAAVFADEIEYVLSVCLMDYLTARSDKAVVNQAKLASYRAGMVSGLVDGLAGSATADLSWCPFDLGWIEGCPLPCQLFRYNGHFAGVTVYARYKTHMAHNKHKLPDLVGKVEPYVDSLLTFNVGFGPQGFYCDNEEVSRNKGVLFMQGLNAHFDNKDYLECGMATLTGFFNSSQSVNV